MNWNILHYNLNLYKSEKLSHLVTHDSYEGGEKKKTQESQGTPGKKSTARGIPSNLGLTIDVLSILHKAT